MFSFKLYNSIQTVTFIIVEKMCEDCFFSQLLTIFEVPNFFFCEQSEQLRRFGRHHRSQQQTTSKHERNEFLAKEPTMIVILLGTTAVMIFYYHSTTIKLKLKRKCKFKSCRRHEKNLYFAIHLNEVIFPF